MLIENIIQSNFHIISDAYKSFAVEKDNCRACELWEHEKQVVQSEGNALNPIFFFIGEAAGENEAKKCRPFIGLAGQRLRRELKKHKHVFNRKTSLISNVVACRPPNNRFPGDPLGPNCASRWLERELKILKPKIIITLGAQALHYIRRSKVGIGASRGNWVRLEDYGAWSFATYHPSYVLRKSREGDGTIEERFAYDIKTIAESWDGKIS